MQGFVLTTNTFTIRFMYYVAEAPHTCRAFQDMLPNTYIFAHARVSGAEFWLGDLTFPEIPQENASVFVLPGEAVLGPSKPERLKTAGTLGFYYGEGKGLDACNIFACVVDEDREELKKLGMYVWNHGAMEITLTAM
ncbi:MAG: DUF3830 family protein [Chitinophagales bacterium]